MNKKLNRVILVDDSEPDNSIHTQLFKECDCSQEIIIFTGAQEALDYLKKSEEKHEYPGMVMLDINMADMDGWEFIEEYKNLPEETQKAYVVNVFSNSSLIADLDKASKTHIKSYVKKPLNMTKIKNLMRLHFPECL